MKFFDTNIMLIWKRMDGKMIYCNEQAKMKLAFSKNVDDSAFSKNVDDSAFSTNMLSIQLS